jgi:ABC-2 type transport system permease protein
MTIMLSANVIVRETEKGTIEQLFITPVQPGELVLEKLVPYLVLTLSEFCGAALLMRTVFAVPIHDDLFTLLVLVLPFLRTMLG